MNDSSHALVSATDREHALDELSRHFSVGRLSAQEFEERSSQVWQARTRRQLAEPFADLPAPPSSAEDLSTTDTPLPSLVVRVGAIAVAAIVCQLALGSAWWLLLLGAIPVVLVVGMRRR
ncbi:DUF1707 SHOCT-like domain-containing protein [Nocardia tengchongensis]|uniref:DUF1707 SHOCT-like domain-containing protein n=1 Tax=Nocardia tengchongensis TaxID=2055889 RepID=UPI0036104B82